MHLFHAQILAEELMYLHGLCEWTFRFDRAKKRFGMCNYSTKSISLSESLTQLNSEDAVRETILHEIAHALAGHSAGHGAKWKETVLKLGGTPARCYGKEICTPPLVYTAICPSCNIRIQRKVKRKIACASCCKRKSGGKFSHQFLFEFYRNLEDQESMT